MLFKISASSCTGSATCVFGNAALNGDGDEMCSEGVVVTGLGAHDEGGVDEMMCSEGVVVTGSSSVGRVPGLGGD